MIDKFYLKSTKNKIPLFLVFFLFSNLFSYDILEDKTTFSKYKKKIYISDGIYRYRNCYVDTHHLKVTENGKVYQTTTDNDSCDKYMFDDFKSYSFKKIEKMIKINQKPEQVK